MFGPYSAHPPLGGPETNSVGDGCPRGVRQGGLSRAIDDYRSAAPPPEGKPLPSSGFSPLARAVEPWALLGSNQ